MKRRAVPGNKKRRPRGRLGLGDQDDVGPVLGHAEREVAGEDALGKRCQERGIRGPSICDGAYLVVEDNGNVKIYAAGGGAAIWSRGTGQ